jgi:hypothetical protein
VIDNFDQVGNKPMSISDLIDSHTRNDYSVYASEFSKGGQLINLDVRSGNQPVRSFHTSYDQPTQN